MSSESRRLFRMEKGARGARADRAAAVLARGLGRRQGRPGARPQRFPTTCGPAPPPCCGGLAWPWTRSIVLWRGWKGPLRARFAMIRVRPARHLHEPTGPFQQPKVKSQESSGNQKPSKKPHARLRRMDLCLMSCGGGALNLLVVGSRPTCPTTRFEPASHSNERITGFPCVASNWVSFDFSSSKTKNKARLCITPSTFITPKSRNISQTARNVG